MLRTETLSTSPNLPTPPMLSGGLPYIGHAIEFYRDPERFFRRGYQAHGNVFGIKLLGQPMAILVGPQEQSFFFKQTDKQLDMEKPYGFLAAIFGKIAFLGSHDTYQLHRPVLHSLFGREQMAGYLPVMSRVVGTWVDGLGERGEMELTHEMAELVKEVAGRCFLGDEVHERLEAAGFWEQYDALSASLDPLLYKLPLPKFIRRDAAKKKIRAILQPLIEERRRQPVADGFQHLLDQPDGGGQPLPDDIIASFFAALMFAGHETTAGQAAWSILHLIENPDYRMGVLEEIDRVLGKAAEVNHVHLRELALVNAAVQETGRLRPSAETLLREVKEDIELSGYRIPAGWFVMTSTAAAHFIPEYFADPYRYDPARFSERKEGAGFELITFGGGLHKCTGMNFARIEMSIILALLFRQYDLELVTPFEKIGVDRGGSSRPTRTLVRYMRK
ncbi:MAG: cytochrome P450 [Anaerolineales bacterium]|nr:cytochrome P450 [Anaerolineales bacterium]